MSAQPAASARLPPAVVLGGGITALSVARSLADAGVAVAVLDVPSSPARRSRAVRSFVDVGATEPQRHMLQWLRSARAGAVLLAGSDDGVELIARHRSALVELGYLPVEGDDRALLQMLDKLQTYELARAHGIPSPRAIRLAGGADVEAAIAQFGFPCVLKPVHSHLFAHKVGRGKVRIARSEPELRRLLEEFERLGVEVFAIEVIFGADDEFVSYYGYLDARGETLLSLTKRKLRQYPPGFGIGTYHETTADPEVAAAGLRFLRAAGVRGLGNVEFKRDARDGRLKLIECNPRFTMSNELIRRAGIDLALFCYSRAAGLEPPPVDSYRVGMRLLDPLGDARAFIAYRRLGELSTRRWLSSLMHRQQLPAFALRDPLPALARAAAMAAHARRVRPDSTSELSTTSPSAVLAPARSGAARAQLRLERLAGGSPRALALAARADILRGVGVGPALRRLRAERELSALGAGARDAVYERIWTEAASLCDAELHVLAPGLFELRRDGVRTRAYQQVVALDDPVTLHLALDKALVQRLLREAGVPTPDFVEWSSGDPRPALSFLARTGGPCVVKPAAGTGGGHGVTPGVRTAAQLLRARLQAADAGERLLIERQAEGCVYRLLLLDGELLDVVRSRPPAVTGDGRATIEQLIARENRRRAAAGGEAGLSLIGFSLDLLLTLERAGLTLSSVLPAGRRLEVRIATNSNSASDNETWILPVAPAVVEAARRAVEAVGLRLAGVDVITPDIGRPLEVTGGMIVEVNGTPGLHHHYLVAQPERATRVAAPILERALQHTLATAPAGGMLGADLGV